MNEEPVDPWSATRQPQVIEATAAARERLRPLVEQYSTHQIALLRRRLEASEAALAAQRAEVAELTAINSRLTRQSKRSKQQLAAITSSRSWAAVRAVRRVKRAPSRLRSKLGPS